MALFRLPGRGEEQNGAAMSLGRTSTFLMSTFNAI
jgi:pyruvate-formate lyase